MDECFHRHGIVEGELTSAEKETVQQYSIWLTSAACSPRKLRSEPKIETALATELDTACPYRDLSGSFLLLLSLRAMTTNRPRAWSRAAKAT